MQTVQFTPSPLVGELFDRLVETAGRADIKFREITPEDIQGSWGNPLRALHVLGIDEGEVCPSASMAEAVGVPVEWYNAERLDVPLDTLLPALGRAVLILLSAWRSQALEYAFQVPAREDHLRAVLTWRERIELDAWLERRGRVA